MSFLIQDTIWANKKFYFDGSRLLDAMVQTLTDQNSDGFDGLEYQFVGDDPIKDRVNINILKEELGVIFIEKQMFKQFTRNNNDEDNNIKNNFQSNLYQDLVRANNFLSAMFLYFFHKFNYDAWPDDVFKSSTEGINAYKDYEANGLPSDKIIKQIKTVFPFMHNFFLKLLEIRYDSQANITIMKVQDGEENLKETELTSKIQKIKTKKSKNLTSQKVIIKQFFFFFEQKNEISEQCYHSQEKIQQYLAKMFFTAIKILWYQVQIHFLTKYFKI